MIANKNPLSQIVLGLLLALSFNSCITRHNYLEEDIRSLYTTDYLRANSDSLLNSFFKVHFNNGDVCLLEDWSLSSDKDSIFGYGKLFDYNRKSFIEEDHKFALDEIAIIETNQLEEIKAKDKEAISGLAVMAGLNVAVALVCLTNPKACFGSCPTFYVDGHDTMFSASAEGFSSSISPVLEASDIDALKYQTDAQKFSLTVKNEALETHVINQIKIHAVEKELSDKVYQSKEGKYFTCDQTYTFNDATNGKVNISGSINELDDLEYFSRTDSFDLCKKEFIYLSYNDDLGQSRTGLVINFRQSLVTTYLLYNGLSYMGSDFANYYVQIENNEKVAKRLRSPFKCIEGIKVFVRNTRNNDWDLVDEIYETGPIAKNLVIVPLPDASRNSDKLDIRIEMAQGSWRIDYLGLATIKEEVHPINIQPGSIETINGNDYSVEKVLFDDDEYMVTLPGNEYVLNFDLPQASDGKNHELFLESKGYYLEWMRDEWLENADPKRLRKFLMNDKKVWRELSEDYKRYELELEEHFWNSKYNFN